MPRKIIASEFYDAVGISSANFWNCCKVIRKANELENSKGKFI